MAHVRNCATLTHPCDPSSLSSSFIQQRPSQEPFSPLCQSLQVQTKPPHAPEDVANKSAVCYEAQSWFQAVLPRPPGSEGLLLSGNVHKVFLTQLNESTQALQTQAKNREVREEKMAGMDIFDRQREFTFKWQKR